ncbi:MAG TPA: TMEM43 family protein [Chthoniobacteraceae bacterium]|nr:TMEM43 family protein [Chthoniobacteraceae bacterium]
MFGGKIVGSLFGALFALLLVPGGVVLLFWNEGRAVKTAQSLKEGQAAVVAASADTVDAGNDHKLVHVTGAALTGEELGDPMFKVSAKALRLKREVSMYQWKESKHKDGQNDTTYTYDKTWDTSLIDSSSFQQPNGHTNPSRMLADSFTTTAQNATFGVFKLPVQVIAKMPGDVALPLDGAMPAPVVQPGRKAQLYNDAFYFGANPGSPEVGDHMVRFTVLNTGTFSIVAMQTGDTFAPYPTHAGRDLLLVEQGDVDAAAMFQHAETNNKILTWVLRAAGLLLLNFGFMMFTLPARALVDFIPILGGIVDFGFAVASFLLSLIITAVTVAIAWLTYRPLIGGALLAVAAICVILLVMHLRGRKAVARTA